MSGVQQARRPIAGPSGNRSHRLTIVYQPIADLKLNPRNPRIHGAKQIRQIASSIEAFGFDVPVLIDTNRQDIAGHGRILACKLLGWTEVPTISLEHLSEAQAKAFMIADNRLTENAVWDDGLLAEQLKELSVLDLDFSLETTGFDMGEIDFRIEGLDASGEADDLSTVPTGPSVTHPGDLWLLGEHRVHCASALDPGAYATLMGVEPADLVFCDPPYNVRIEGNVSGSGKVKHREFAMASGEMSGAEFTNFLTRSLSSLHARHAADGSLHFICMDWRHMDELLSAGRTVYSELKNLCIWAKNNGGMGSLYRSQHELVFTCRSHPKELKAPASTAPHWRRGAVISRVTQASCVSSTRI